MQAWQCDNPTGIDSLVWRDLPDPQPAADEVVVAIAAASLNFPDILMVQNKYQIKPPTPFVPGAEFAGTITQVGSEVTHLLVPVVLVVRDLEQTRAPWRDRVPHARGSQAGGSLRFDAAANPFQLRAAGLVVREVDESPALGPKAD